ncbi:MAG: hypothetical protein JWL98_957 [Xanthomonadaceae bacterium]|nr:hypothetical protein [Xanthomonadaceae bacterium]
MANGTPRSDVLHRFLVLQQAVVGISDDQRVASYCRRALQYVPGVAEAWICLRGALYPDDEQIRKICEVTGRSQKGFLSLDTPEVERRHGILIFSLQAQATMCGMFIIRPRDAAEVEPYLPIIAGFASFMGVVLANRDVRRRLADENITLRGDRVHLEHRVEQRDRELEFSITHDTLTGLPNRMTVDDRLSQALSYSRRYGLKVAVGYINLDSFKYVQDSLGYDVSDEILVVVGQRLRSICQPNDTVARISADHFAMVVTSQEEAADPAALLNLVLAEVRKPIIVGTREIVVTCTIGCSRYPGDGDTAEALLQRASIASYRGRETGRDRMYFYAAGDHAVVNDRAELESDLRSAVGKSQFLLYYQPKVALAKGSFVGVEALLRWQHPTRGRVSPAKFIPIAEESGTIFEIGEWALSEACRQAQRWRKQGVACGSVAVNLSTRQLRDYDIVEVVRRTLGDSGLPSELLELEITESSIMHGVELVLPLLLQLKALGVQLAIDDFGTGYSNLNYLRLFPVDRLKIDQSLIHEVESVDSAAAVARGVISLGHTLGLKVVAEGVETIEQARFLQSAGCDEIQGYLISQPLPVDELGSFLKSKPRLDWLSADATAEVRQRSSA